MSQGKANGRYTCTCDHLTNFAVLFDVHGSGFGDHERPLQTITYVGSIVSIIALVLTLLSFTITGKQRQSARSPHARNQRLVLINLCVALLAILITFLAGIDRTASPIVCTAVAALLHYFLLAALMWMVVEAVMIFLATVMVFGHYVSESFVYKAAVVAWGFPLFAMMSTVGPSSLYEYKNSDYLLHRHVQAGQEGEGAENVNRYQEGRRRQPMDTRSASSGLQHHVSVWSHMGVRLLCHQRWSTCFRLPVLHLQHSPGSLCLYLPLRLEGGYEKVAQEIRLQRKEEEYVCCR
ncbi:PREDICTED: adhesion G-protein coupled receptor D1-like isoform X2 [Branchiostoma belcheri]|uniref:Adhesion G-protein coupled receptor D1-like isoform X2 n=1 Tax=Branchiostoma belcheri TaxID=7741 RepID=A0A6P4YXX5_BRABE|nr:PREDICTED: adhesion G-protein coupled receptor D1-like isoform X2 [Branchiostoma belcheri]